MIERFAEVLTTFTDESFNAALNKCKELGLDPNRGIKPLDEALQDLAEARIVMDDAVKKGKIEVLPISIQQSLLHTVEEISRFLTGMASGTDDVVNLANAV